MTTALKVAAVGVIGAGAMGNGIAQVAATNGHRVMLFDTDPAAVQRAMGIIARNLSRAATTASFSPAVNDAGESRLPDSLCFSAPS